VYFSGVDSLHRKSDSERFSGLNSVALVILLMVQIGYDVTIRSRSAMFLMLATAAGTWLLFTYYTCDLTARMTARKVNLAMTHFLDTRERMNRGKLLFGQKAN
jgi:hypothetical protein